MNNTHLVSETVYQEIVKTYLDKGTIEAVAAALNVSEVKVRKVLITEGLWSSPTSARVKYYFEQGITSEKIAELLHSTVKAVQQYLPYTKGLYRGDYPSEDARYSSEYRERIRIAKENVLKKNRDRRESCPANELVLGGNARPLVPHLRRRVAG